MAINPGVNVSKLDAYAVLNPPAGAAVTKLNAYAVLLSATLNTGVSVSKLNAYAVLANVPPVGVAPSWGSVSFPNGQVGVAYSQAFDLAPATAPTTFSLVSGALPAGLSLSNLTGDQGQLAGSPTTAGTFSFTLRATNTYGTADQAFSIAIAAAANQPAPSAKAIFPTLKSPNWQLIRTPFWNTTVKTATTKDRRRAPLRAKPLWKWTLKNSILQSDATIADLQAIQNFYNARAGSFDSFLWQDPESDSLPLDPDVSSYLGQYWPVAFTIDFVDFERFAHQLWKAGTFTFTQIVLAPAELWRIGGYGALAHGPITIVRLHLLTSHTNDTNGTGGYGVASFNSFVSVFDLNEPHVFYDLSDWTLRSDTVVLYQDAETQSGLNCAAVAPAGAVPPTVTQLTGLKVWLRDLQSLNQDYLGAFGGLAGPVTFQIYDCYIDVTYSDGSTATWRPGEAAILENGVGGSVTDAANAIDGDPATCATITRTAFRSLWPYDADTLVLSGFTPA